jgi:riboflavin biosynthesis pyrimidine reductase
LNAGFFNARLRKKPLVALKIAESADGFVADPAGNGRWITSATARQHGHLLRSRHEVILTGIGTVLADDPLLTCRLPGPGGSLSGASRVGYTSAASAVISSSRARQNSTALSYSRPQRAVVMNSPRLVSRSSASLETKMAGSRSLAAAGAFWRR